MKNIKNKYPIPKNSKRNAEKRYYVTNMEWNQNYLRWILRTLTPIVNTIDHFEILVSRVDEIEEELTVQWSSRSALSQYFLSLR